jgi:hypothetical protein
MKRMLIVVRQRGHLSVASDDSLCPSAGTNFSSSASDTLRLHSGHRSSPRPNSARVACRSAKPALFFRPISTHPHSNPDHVGRVGCMNGCNHSLLSRGAASPLWNFGADGQTRTADRRFTNAFAAVLHCVRRCLSSQISPTTCPAFAGCVWEWWSKWWSASGSEEPPRHMVRQTMIG